MQSYLISNFRISKKKKSDEYHLHNIDNKMSVAILHEAISNTANPPRVLNYARTSLQ